MLPQTKIARLGAPIVLAHGLFGFTRIGVGPVDAHAVFPGRFPRSSEAAGNRVLVTRVPPIAGVEHRAGRLGEQILQAFPDEPVHLIGHSMGGLDARRLLADPSWQRRVLSLTTIGTPHLGTALADFAKLQSRPRLPAHELRWESIRRAASTSPAGPRGGSTAGMPLRRTCRASRVAGRPDARDGLLAPHAHFRRTLGAGRAERWLGLGRVRARLRHPPARTGPSITFGR